ncbi:VIT domain-containing protein [Treponema sp.]|uniref:VIT domain-containing protein n=1 Tax=Treponema sp. TaxID=166 RepID=UPI0025CC038E|nr:VIT domain-containing protein [Treponema sp.]MCR5219048.1 hypothetical protein [Treponema sp.]
MKKLFSLIAAFFLGSSLFAQLMPQIIMTTTDKKSDGNVRLKDLSVDVEVAANIATTKLDMIFENTSISVLEGELEFPLGENECITGYALDINGHLRDGVIVEKEKGRQVFEAVVRKGIDPGLAEKTKGNNFKIRVYPLPANSNRHVQITYQSQIDSSGKYVYSALPQGMLDNFNFKITVLKNNLKIEESAFDKADFTFNDMSQGTSASITRKNCTLTSPLTFTLPEKDSIHEKVFIETIGKDTYFYFTADPALQSQAKKLPQSICVWWDTSSSGENRNLNKETELLESYLALLNNPQVKIIPFSNIKGQAKSFKGNSKKTLKEIRDYILSLTYDGATNLDMDFDSEEGDEILIFSDGISNWKNPDSQKYTNDRIIYMINSSPVSNPVWLSSYAEKHSGSYINLSSATVQDGLTKLTQNPVRLIKAEYDSKKICDLYPEDKSVVDQNFSVSGILKKKDGKVTLHFGHGNTIEKSITVNINGTDSPEAKNIARQWAVKKINCLNRDYANNRNAIVETAKKFGVITEDTSLIVLDSVYDYLEYGITPPENDKILYEEYKKILKENSSFNNKNAETYENSKKIPEKVYVTFEEFSKWWKTAPKEFKKKPVFDDQESDDEHVVYRLFSTRNESYTSSLSESLSLDTEEIYETEDSIAGESKSKKASEKSLQPESVKVQLEAWSPDEKYLTELKKTKTENMYKKYLELKKEHSSSPAFYMSVSDYFASEGLQEESMRILSNLAELNLENTDILRALAYKLMEREEYKTALPVFEERIKLKS